MAQALALVLIDRVERVAARASAPTWSTPGRPWRNRRKDASEAVMPGTSRPVRLLATGGGAVVVTARAYRRPVHPARWDDGQVTATEPQLVGAADVDDAVAVLASAFAEDPTWAWVFPDPALRPAQHAWLWRVFVEGARRYSSVWLSADRAATAV